MFSIRHIDHLVLRVADAERMIRFYCDVVGCSLDKRVDRLGLIHLRAGSSLIDLVTLDGSIGKAGGGAPEAGRHNMDHLCLRIEPFDAEALRAHLAAHGIEMGEVHDNYGAEGNGPSIYFRDPEGNLIELKGPSTR